jgi:hypothetical protein
MDGTLPEGTLLPSERELCQKHGISRTTVRQALQDLSQKGYCQTIHGKGTVVVRPQIRQELRNRGSRPQWRDPRIRNRFLTAAYLGVALTSWFNPFLTNPMGISLLMLTATAVYTTINDYRK